MCKTRKKMEKWVVFEAPKTMKTFVYVYNTRLLVLGISKEDFTVFLTPCKPSRMVFGIHCNRLFYKFTGRTLL